MALELHPDKNKEHGKTCDCYKKINKMRRVANVLLRYSDKIKYDHPIISSTIDCIGSYLKRIFIDVEISREKAFEICENRKKFDKLESELGIIRKDKNNS